jgi:hypothetical protein
MKHRGTCNNAEDIFKLIYISDVILYWRWFAGERKNKLYK